MIMWIDGVEAYSPGRVARWRRRWHGDSDDKLDAALVSTSARRFARRMRAGLAR